MTGLEFQCGDLHLKLWNPVQKSPAIVSEILKFHATSYAGNSHPKYCTIFQKKLPFETMTNSYERH